MFNQRALLSDTGSHHQLGTVVGSKTPVSILLIDVTSTENLASQAGTSYEESYGSMYWFHKKKIIWVAPAFSLCSRLSPRDKELGHDQARSLSEQASIDALNLSRAVVGEALNFTRAGMHVRDLIFNSL